MINARSKQDLPAPDPALNRLADLKPDLTGRTDIQALDHQSTSATTLPARPTRHSGCPSSHLRQSTNGTTISIIRSVSPLCSGTRTTWGLPHDLEYFLTARPLIPSRKRPFTVSNRPMTRPFRCASRPTTTSEQARKISTYDDLSLSSHAIRAGDRIRRGSAAGSRRLPRRHPDDHRRSRRATGSFQVACRSGGTQKLATIQSFTNLELAVGRARYDSQASHPRGLI